ncbi:TPA: PDZ domain-containing protein, partial [Candidatus Poribacteria bacterium]|nr:PDZ domain-containing protein [Candidatus Poribacteria bacterium]
EQILVSNNKREYAPKKRKAVQSGIHDSRYNAIVQAIEKANSSIVNISSIHVEKIDPWFDLFRIPFEIPRRREYRGLGSGIIFDTNGYVLTNQHVIEDADVIKVVLNDGREFEAELVGEDSLSDIAVLRINATNLPQVEFGNSDDLLIGEWAIAIGNPFATFVKDPKPTVTVGVISATNRALQSRDRIYRNMIQTDASINPGNSGGALVNSFGQVIGVNTAIYSTSGGSQGIGFAIPINIARRVIDKLVNYGIVVEPWIGLEYQELTEEIIQYMKLKDVTGLIVTKVIKNSPAQKAGMKKMDIIEAIDGQDIHTIDDAAGIIRLLKIGETVTYDIIRDGKKNQVDIFIEQLIDSYTAWGITVKPLTPSLAKQYRNKGVIISDIKRNSPLGRAGLKKGDLIYAISNYRISSLSDFATLAKRIRSNQRVRIYFERDNEEYILRITL